MKRQSFEAGVKLITPREYLGEGKFNVPPSNKTTWTILSLVKGMPAMYLSLTTHSRRGRLGGPFAYKRESVLRYLGGRGQSSLQKYSIEDDDATRNVRPGYCTSDRDVFTAV